MQDEKVTIPGFGQLPALGEETSAEEQGSALVRLMRLVEQATSEEIVQNAQMLWSFGYADRVREIGFNEALHECILNGPLTCARCSDRPPASGSSLCNECEHGLEQARTGQDV